MEKQTKIISKWEKVESFGIKKSSQSFIKKFILGIMAGIFVGLGYIGFFKNSMF